MAFTLTATVLLLGLITINPMTAMADDAPTGQCQPNTDDELIETLQSTSNRSLIHSAYHIRLNEHDFFRMAFRPANRILSGNTTRLIKFWLKRFQQGDAGFSLICRQEANWQIPSNTSQTLNKGRIIVIVVGRLTRTADCNTTEAICFLTNNFNESCLLEYLHHNPEHFPQPERAPNQRIAPNLWTSVRRLTVCQLPLRRPLPTWIKLLGSAIILCGLFFLWFLLWKTFLPSHRGLPNNPLAVRVVYNGDTVSGIGRR